MDTAVSKIDKLIENKGDSSLVVTPNSEMIVMAQKDLGFRNILNQADLTVPDGIGVVWAARLLGAYLPERVTGIDLMSHIFELADKKDYRIYFLGGKPGVTKQAKRRILSKYPELKIIGDHHGYLDKKREINVIEEINSLQPDLLFVGMGVPLQEKWLAKNLSSLQVSVGIGVGGSFDVLAGQKERAPVWVQRLGLEWLYRLLQEPERLIRILSLPKFVYLVIKRMILS
nr:WecB/TagA/CpsF family glycosyltransferase [Sporohalobacter salinus]